MKTEFKISYFFWIKRKSAGKIPVYIRSKQNSDKQISYFTEERVLMDSIKVVNKKLRNGKVKKTYSLKNKTSNLIELEADLQATYKDLSAQGYEPTLSDLLKHRKDAKKPTDKNIVAWCDDYLKSPYSEGQRKSVHTLKTNLAGDVKKEITGFNSSLTFDKLTKPRIKSFFEWLTAHGVANNSQYKRLRALINVAEHANIELPDLKNYELPYKTTNAEKPRLNWQEVKKVMDTEAKSDLEQVAKDVFLLACFSGLRIDDILNLQEGELHNFYYERIQRKTNTTVLVTIHKHNEELFKKYINGVGYVRQTLSAALKPLLERSGLTKKVIRIQLVGYVKKETASPKFEEISFHSGRRFYARLLNDIGCGGEIARDELGHSFKSVTELYAGSQEHKYRVARVRKAIDGMEETMEELSLMKVA